MVIHCVRIRRLVIQRLVIHRLRIRRLVIQRVVIHRLVIHRLEAPPADRRIHRM